MNLPDYKDHSDSKLNYSECMTRCTAACAAGDDEEEEYWFERAEAIDSGEKSRERAFGAECAKYGYRKNGSIRVYRE